MQRLPVEAAVQWVQEHLATYCSPGEHRFVGASSRVRWCTHCYKEELRGTHTCLICDSPGDVAGDLELERVIQASGMLCDDCEAGLRSRQDGLASWKFSRDDALAEGIGSARW